MSGAWRARLSIWGAIALAAGVLWASAYLGAVWIGRPAAPTLPTTHRLRPGEYRGPSPPEVAEAYRRRHGVVMPRDAIGPAQ